MLVYIAAPLGDPDPVVRAWHRERANLLAALAFAVGHVPVCVHTYAELAIGSDTDPDARERGLKRSMDALDTVFDAGGCMWVLLRDDGSCSTGTLAEVDLWYSLRAASSRGDHPKSHPWHNWRRVAGSDAPHLLPEFDRLTTRPTP